MKKGLLTLLLLLVVPFLGGCFGIFNTELVANQDQAFLTIKENFVEYLPYQKEDIPTYTLTFPGLSINSTLQRTGENEVIFSGNDDFVVSDVIAKLLAEYEAKERISYRLITEETRNETHLNRHVIQKDGTIKSEKVYLKVTDGIIENKIAYMTLENGLQLTINFRTFEGTYLEQTKRYYSWQYTESMRLILYYPLMIIKNSDHTKSILIIALPNAIINKIETRYEPSGLLEKDEYLDPSYYTYEYADYDVQTSGSKYDNSSQVVAIKAYYEQNFNGREIDGLFYYDYLGYTFKVTFQKTNFTITYVKPLN
ncbi:MAG: hypothetical protein RBR48_02075 [Bacilli bacterium]|jgi:hypothetical protein|nr:hypothetical protein [Bacilli bacterium]MDD3348224.1 hypothetical protein [Bacilli bacterium]MDD4056476.1 hypothetical protein [Bacilli bacterium]MDY0208954.1 hypothetical protein [Bacilli bacterium]